MAKSTPTRLSVDSPATRTYIIISDRYFEKNKSSLVKYIKGVPNGKKTDEGKNMYDDKVFQEWVENPLEIPLIGREISFTTKIV